MSFFFVIILSIILIISIDKRLNTILYNYIDVEAKRIVTHVISKSIKEVDDIEINDYLTYSDDNIKYNMSSINIFKNNLLEIIQKNFSEIEKGNYSKYPLFFQYDKDKYKHMRSGYLCEVSFYSTRGSTVFANIGPFIPIRLSFIGDVNVNLDLKTREYGINNVVVELDAIVEVNNKVTMPISSKNHIIKVREPISINIIKGEIPENYLYGKK